MKCPRCGHEMTLDTHRKYALNMCYECGYIEGRLIDPEKKGESNFERMKKLNFNEMVAFLTKGLNLDEAKLADWLDDHRILRAAPNTGCGVFFAETGKRIDAFDKDSSNFSTFFGECVP